MKNNSPMDKTIGEYIRILGGKYEQHNLKQKEPHDRNLYIPANI